MDAVEFVGMIENFTDYDVDCDLFCFLYSRVNICILFDLLKITINLS